MKLCFLVPLGTQTAALAATLAASVLCPILARSADLHALLAAPRQRVQTADYRATGRLVRVDANGARTSYGITVKAHWFPGVLRVELEIASPADARAHILFEMRPSGQNIIRIAHPGDKVPAAGCGCGFDTFIAACMAGGPGATIGPDLRNVGNAAGRPLNRSEVATWNSCDGLLKCPLTMALWIS